MSISHFVAAGSIEVHTENGIEAPAGSGGWRRSALVAVLVLCAIAGIGMLFLWVSGIAEASAPGGCGG